jgi:murein DD-endopeptidase MepM/ murein hydrolase activator NlpD
MAVGVGSSDTRNDNSAIAPASASASLRSVTEQSASGIGGTGMLPAAKLVSPDAEVRKLIKSQRIAQDRAAADAAKRQRYVVPAAGLFTSGFGGRWGTTHYGIDIGNVKGTPIVSVADGTVIEAGRASGFGLWVRVLHDDGTITVYGHVDTITAYAGQRVKAGTQIATMGDRGFATGVHLHFEVWDPAGKKINPLPWLAARGITVPGDATEESAQP